MSPASVSCLPALPPATPFRHQPRRPSETRRVSIPLQEKPRWRQRRSCAKSARSRRRARPSLGPCGSVHCTFPADGTCRSPPRSTGGRNHVSNVLPTLAFGAVVHRWFGQLSLTLIIVFSIMLAMYDPLDPDNETPGNKFISVTEKVFTVFFTIEVRCQLLLVWLPAAFGVRKVARLTPAFVRPCRCWWSGSRKGSAGTLEIPGIPWTGSSWLSGTWR